MQFSTPIENDAIVFGLLAIILGIIFYTSSIKTGFWAKFYTYVPALLMCYIVPAVLSSTGLVDVKLSQTDEVAKNFLLPAALVLMTLSIDLKAVFNLGPKALIMFFTATVGVVIGGPLAVIIVGSFSPETVGGEGTEAVWKGLSTLAGSWIGGAANQTAMKEMYEYSDEAFSAMVIVDIVVANIWMAFLLLGVGIKDRLDKWLKADSSSIDALTKKVEQFALSIERKATLSDFMIIIGIAFGATAIAHFLSAEIVALFKSSPALSESVLASGFFWIVVLATTIGLGLSFTKARNYEGAGASKVGSVFIYVLVGTIGMKMDLSRMFDNELLILVGLIWMAIHVGLLTIVAKIIRAPFFFLAVGSKANIGGAASAPVVAAAFHPALATVGVLLAVLGYALGTYGAIACAEMMHLVAP